MRKALYVAASIGSATLMISSVVMAQNIPGLPIGFGAAGMGVLDNDAACATATGGTCSTIAAGNGFVQRQIEIGGQTFIQTVIDDGSGSFQDENFVQITFGGGGQTATQGVADRLTVADGPGFTTTGQIMAGWANDLTPGSGTHANIVMTIDDQTDPANAFTNSFSVDTEFVAAAGTNVLRDLKIDQLVYLNDPADLQHFYTNIKGSAATSVAAYTIPGGAQAVTWNAGDAVQVLWIGQDMTAGAGVGAFGTESAQQVDLATGTGVTATSFTSLNSVGPWDWAAGTPIGDEFGVAPVFGTPVF